MSLRRTRPRRLGSVDSQPRVNAREHGLQTGAENVNNGNDGNSDAPGNEAIFDGRYARLIGNKIFDQAGHEVTPLHVKKCCD